MFLAPWQAAVMQKGNENIQHYNIFRNQMVNAAIVVNILAKCHFCS